MELALIFAQRVDFDERIELDRVAESTHPILFFHSLVCRFADIVEAKKQWNCSAVYFPCRKINGIVRMERIDSSHVCSEQIASTTSIAAAFDQNNNNNEIRKRPVWRIKHARIITRSSRYRPNVFVCVFAELSGDSPCGADYLSPEKKKTQSRYIQIPDGSMRNFCANENYNVAKIRARHATTPFAHITTRSTPFHTVHVF